MSATEYMPIFPSDQTSGQCASYLDSATFEYGKMVPVTKDSKYATVYRLIMGGCQPFKVDRRKTSIGDEAYEVRGTPLAFR